MAKTICPFLGLQDDPMTALDFPSEGNYCHHARPISPIKRSFQRTYCLTVEHTICPLFQAAQPQPLPSTMAEPANGRRLSRRKLAMIAGPLLLVAFTALLITWNHLGSRFGWLNFIPNTGGSPQTDELSMLDTNLPGGGPTAEPTPTSSARPLVVSCVLPDGWVPYIITPTDSLFRLSVMYGITVADLQLMNCMGQKTAILPGQVIYVPYIITPAPTVTDSPTATNTLVQIAPQVNLPDNNGISNSPSATPAPPPPQANPVPPPSSNPQPTPVPSHPPANPPPPAPVPNPPPPQPQPQPPNPPGNNNGGHNGNGNGHGNGNGKGNGKGGGHGH